MSLPTTSSTPIVHSHSHFPSASCASTSSSSITYLRPEVEEIKNKLESFVNDECIPAETLYNEHIRNFQIDGKDRWSIDAIPPIIETLKQRSKELGLWNLFIPIHLIHKVPKPSLKPVVSLSYREYGILCEILGRCPNIAPEVCNTSAPDTGNMEVLLEYGTQEQCHKYLIPLLEGNIRSTFLMTEPDVASSDATNLQTKLIKKRKTSGRKQQQQPKSSNDYYENDDDDDDIEYVLVGRKWWSTGAMDPRCRVALVVARVVEEKDQDEQEQKNIDDTHNHPAHRHPRRGRHNAHTVVAVPMPHPGVQLIRPLKLFGYDDAPNGHAELILDNIVLTSKDLILGEGSGFHVAQARLGPGRIHHCMRSIGMAARCYEMMLLRTMERKTFGKYLWEHGMCQQHIADSLSDLTSARLLTLHCASLMDGDNATYNSNSSSIESNNNRRNNIKEVRDLISTIKVTVPQLTYRVVDRAVQIYGGAGVSDDDNILGRTLVGIRSLRIADGPDDVHKRTVALIQIKNMMKKRMMIMEQQQQQQQDQQQQQPQQYKRKNGFVGKSKL